MLTVISLAFSMVFVSSPQTITMLSTSPMKLPTTSAKCSFQNLFPRQHGYYAHDHFYFPLVRTTECISEGRRDFGHLIELSSEAVKHDMGSVMIHD
jgi:hypothetical protein